MAGMSIAPSSSPPPYYPPPNSQRRGNGCLWGCLIVLLIFMLPVILTGGYTAWFLTNGYKSNPVLRVAGELVREDGMAQQVLGRGATITGVEGNYFSWMPGVSRGGYEMTLEGPKGEGHLSVTAHNGTQLDSAILTGPDGRRYDLMKHQALPGNDGERPDTSI
jgi:hypothetical protein